jgi:hypothetical protein
MADDDAILSRLRAATEADVEAVLAANQTTAEIELVDASDLLAFFHNMLDQLLPGWRGAAS